MRLTLAIAILCGCTAASAQTPAITSVANAASFQTGTLAPGSAASVFGTNLATANALPTAYPLPTYLGGASVYVNGMNAPLTYVSPTQINFQVPWETPVGTGSVVIISNNQTSNQLSVKIAAAAPGIFNGWVFSSAYGSMAQSTKLHAGEYLTILATGLGAVDAPPATGQTLADATLTKVLAPISVTVGGAPATIGFAGLAPPGPNPYSVGLYEIIVQVPAAPTGDAVPVVVTAGGVSSNAVNIAVATGSATSVAKYIEIGPSSTVIARAIVSEPTCPSITLDGKSQVMAVRAAATLPFYPVTSCETTIPATAQAVSIEGTDLKMPVQDPTRITVVGDTGCRMDNTTSQACYTPSAWPVAAINTNAVATNPQLLIHNGDYHYREYQCFPTVAGCQGSPWGYNWDVWREDLFKPFNSLLATAPWVFTRGNHETCDRAGEGWFRFLDPRALPSTCLAYTDPYSLSIGATQIVELDSAVADDAIAYPDQIAAMMPQFDQVRAMAANNPNNTWVLTHRPIWAIRSNINSSVVLQAASNNDLGATALVMSGHTHTFQSYSFTPVRAPQLVIGNSGDNLASAPTIPLIGAIIGNEPVVSAISVEGFGYATMTPAGPGSWTIVSKDFNGNTTSTCAMQPGLINCSK